jgi:dTDP-4-dehydrorhamnose reductase
MDRLLITGGTGYLGRVLVRLAVLQGMAPIATWHTQSPPTPSADQPVTWVPLDITDPAAVQHTIATHRPQAIIHTAYRQNDPHRWAVTAEATRTIASAAHQVGAHLVHLSSDVIFNGERDSAYTEADPPEPVNPYGQAKADAEQFVQTHCPDATIVRTSLTYGFHPPDRHTRFILSIADGHQHARLFTDEYRCPIFVDDLAAALLELVARPYHGILNIAGGQRLSRHAFGVLLARAYGRDPDRLPAGRSSESREPRPRNCTLDIGLARSLLTTRLRGVEEVVASNPGIQEI